MSDWQQELEAFNQAYADAEAPSGGQDYSTPIPDGTYQVKVLGCELKHANSSGAPMLAWSFQIIGGNKDYLDRLLWKNSVIQVGPAMEFLKKDLAVCGIRLPAFSALPMYVGRLVGKALEILKKTTVKNGTEYKNVYIQKLLSAAPQAQAAPPPEEDDGIPF
jgi:hypothetical protein